MITSDYEAKWLRSTTICPKLRTNVTKGPHCDWDFIEKNHQFIIFNKPAGFTRTTRYYWTTWPSAKWGSAYARTGLAAHRLIVRPLKVYYYVQKSRVLKTANTKQFKNEAVEKTYRHRWWASGKTKTPFHPRTRRIKRNRSSIAAADIPKARAELSYRCYPRQWSLPLIGEIKPKTGQSTRFIQIIQYRIPLTWRHQVCISNAPRKVALLTSTPGRSASTIR
jgi:hypothetical protein